MSLASIQSSVQNVMLFCKKRFMIFKINLVNLKKKKNPFSGPGRDPPSCNILSVSSGSYMFLDTLPFGLTFISWKYCISISQSKRRPSGVVSCTVNKKVKIQTQTILSPKPCLFCFSSPMPPGQDAKRVHSAVPAEARDDDKADGWFSPPSPKTMTLS